MHNPITPVHAGEIQCISLGIGVKILDNEGNEIIARSQPGELVCVRPFPSQPTYFLSDPGGKIYKAAYYELYKGLWHHADFVQFGEHGGIVMLGRSDGGLNPNGVRFGSAETYSITENIPEVIDALCVGQRRPEDTEEVVVLFVMTRKREDFTLALASRIKTAIRSGLSPRHGKAVMIYAYRIMILIVASAQVHILDSWNSVDPKCKENRARGEADTGKKLSL